MPSGITDRLRSRRRPRLGDRDDVRGFPQQIGQRGRRSAPCRGPAGPTPAAPIGSCQARVSAATGTSDRSTPVEHTTSIGRPASSVPGRGGRRRLPDAVADDRRLDRTSTPGPRRMRVVHAERSAAIAPGPSRASGWAVAPGRRCSRTIDDGAGEGRVGRLALVHRRDRIPVEPADPGLQVQRAVAAQLLGPHDESCDLEPPRPRP